MLTMLKQGDLNDIKGHTISKLTTSSSKDNPRDSMGFTIEGNDYSFKCISMNPTSSRVKLTDICGDVTWILGLPIADVKEVKHGNKMPTDDELYHVPLRVVPEEGRVYTWVFHTIATQQGAVMFRWLCYLSSDDANFHLTRE